jgi:hypothetical protein
MCIREVLGWNHSRSICLYFRVFHQSLQMSDQLMAMSTSFRIIELFSCYSLLVTGGVMDKNN